MRNKWLSLYYTCYIKAIISARTVSVTQESESGAIAVDGDEVDVR